MSLLLLLPSTISTPVGWTVTNTSSSSWVKSHWDFKNIWGEWETMTWGAIQSSGLTWGNMSGYTFAATGAPTTTWTVV